MKYLQQLQPEYLEDMIRTAVNQKVERCIKSFFNNHVDFTSSPSSHLLSAPQKQKYQINLDFFFDNDYYIIICQI
jgi:hypothetical protein